MPPAQPQVDIALYVGLFVVIGVFILSAILLVMQILKLSKRNPPVSEEIDAKLSKCQAHNNSRFEGMAKKIDRLDEDLKARSAKGDEGRRRIHTELKTLARESASQQTAIDTMNQRQVQMDAKIDRVLEKI